MHDTTRERPAPAPKPGNERRTSKDIAVAWLCLLALPVAWVAAFIVLNGLTSVMGYDIWNDPAPPLWPGIVALVPTILVASVPVIVSTSRARRAGRGGDNRGWVPAGILLVITVSYVGPLAISFVGGALSTGR